MRQAKAGLGDEREYKQGRSEMAATGKVLVTGATGNIGSGLVPALKQAGVDVRALVHQEEKAGALREQGVEVVVGDLEDPKTSETAVAGVDKIYLLVTNGTITLGDFPEGAREKIANRKSHRDAL